MIGLAIICGYLSSEESYKILQEQTQREEQEEREYQKDLI